jgi:hypothetical protein
MRIKDKNKTFCAILAAADAASQDEQQKAVEEHQTQYTS